MTTASAERSLQVRSRADRNDVATFLTRATRLDPAAVVRLRMRDAQRVELWTTTGFDVLATRVFSGRVRPADTTAAADVLLGSVTGPAAGDGSADDGETGGDLDLGFSVDSSWRATLPPLQGFTHVDDVPVAVVHDLARRGVDLAAESGGRHGPPSSLLDQSVIEVSSASEGGAPVGVPMRMVLALTAMNFAPTTDGDVVRVRAHRTWVRLDARFGSVAVSRRSALSLSVLAR